MAHYEIKFSKSKILNISRGEPHHAKSVECGPQKYLRKYILFTLRESNYVEQGITSHQPARPADPCRGMRRSGLRPDGRRDGKFTGHDVRTPTVRGRAAFGDESGP